MPRRIGPSRPEKPLGFDSVAWAPVTRRVALARRNGALAKYREGFRKRPETPEGAAIRLLLNRHPVELRSHRMIEAMFENAVPYSTIRNWRYGHREMPGWARDLLRAHLQPFVELRDELKSKRPAD